MNIFDDDFLGSTYEAIDPDPYDIYLKRNYTRKPTALEIERIAKIEELDPRSSSGEELRFCIDTDEWVYTSQTCYISVKNLTACPVEFTISRIEVLEYELVPPHLSDCYKFFNTLYKSVEGGAISQTERKRLKLTGRSEFTYGEVDFMHMVPVFNLCEPKPNEIFYDLGCGTGKCMVGAALACPFLKVVKGIEFLPGLFESCKSTIDSISTDLEIAPFETILGNILDED